MKIDNNKVATIYYQAFDLDSGELLDSNYNTEPIEFIMGKGHIVSGLEEGVSGMSVGESKEIVVQSANAYGAYRAELVKEMPIDHFEGIELQNGMTLVSINDDNKREYVKVAGFDQETVSIDYNHPMSGKDISFKVEVIDIRNATQEELETGVVYKEKHSCGCSGCGC
jgi:FKBP-type peptidyl-prolyl cis-trans isomerase SlyD